MSKFQITKGFEVITYYRFSRSFDYLINPNNTSLKQLIVQSGLVHSIK